MAQPQTDTPPPARSTKAQAQAIAIGTNLSFLMKELVAPLAAQMAELREFVGRREAERVAREAAPGGLVARVGGLEGRTLELEQAGHFQAQGLAAAVASIHAESSSRERALALVNDAVRELEHQIRERIDARVEVAMRGLDEKLAAAVGASDAACAGRLEQEALASQQRSAEQRQALESALAKANEAQERRLSGAEQALEERLASWKAEHAASLAQLQEEQQQQLAASQAAWADCPSVEDVAATIDAKLSESSSQVPSEMAEQLRATEEQLAASVASLAAMSDRLDASEAGVDVRVARLETAVKQAQAQTTMASEAVQPVAAELGDEQEGSPTLQTALRQMLDHTDANARAACSQAQSALQAAVQVQEDLEAAQKSWRQELVPMQLVLERRSRQGESGVGTQSQPPPPPPPSDDVIETVAELREDLNLAQRSWREELVSVQVALARQGREQEEDIDACNVAILNLSELLGDMPSDDTSRRELGTDEPGNPADKN